MQSVHLNFKKLYRNIPKVEYIEELLKTLIKF